MQQVNNRGNLDLDEPSYFSIIRGKTAELTAVSAKLSEAEDHWATLNEELGETEE